MSSVKRQALFAILVQLATTQMAVAADPEQLRLAKDLMGKQKYPEAIARFSTLINADPSCADCFIQRALCKCWSGQWADGVLDFDRAIAIDAKSFDARIHRANALGSLDKLPAALKDVNDAIALQPRSPVGYICKAKLQAKRKQFVEARLTLDEGKKKAVADKQLSAAYADIANLEELAAFGEASDLFRRNQGKLALKAIEKVPDWNKRCTLVKVHAFYLQRLGESDKAMAEFQKAISLFPKDRELRMCRAAWFLTIREKRQIAEQDLSAIESQCQKDADFFALKASLQKTQGQIKKAVESLLIAIDLEPDNPTYHFDCARLQMESKQYQVAADQLSHFLKLHPHSVGYLLLCDVYKGKHDLTNAGHALDSAVETAKTEDERLSAFSSRGDFYFDTGDDRSAVSDYTKALKIAPGNMQLREKLRKATDELGALGARGSGK